MRGYNYFCRWAKIASHFPGRTDNEIKNHWNTRIKKRLKLLGVDPVTHSPIEPKEKSEMITETTPDSTSPVPETRPETSDITDKKSEMNAGSDETMNLSSNYEGLLENLDVLLWMNQEANTSTSYSPSFSLEESLSNPLMGESSYIQEDTIQQWGQSVDSMLSWDDFNQLQEELYYFGYR